MLRSGGAAFSICPWDRVTDHLFLPHVALDMIARTGSRRVLVCILLFLLSCSGKVTEQGQQDTLTVGCVIPERIEELDPLSGPFAYSPLVELVFNGLVRVDDRLEVVPDLAESWEVSEDGLTWTFHLKKGVTFHDGVECTAEDVKFTYDLVMDPAVDSHLLPALRQFNRVEVVDRYEIAIHLRQPHAPILASLNAPIVPEHLLRGTDYPSVDFNLHPVGTGPFRLRSWEPDTQIVFEANENYFGGKPKLSQVAVSVYSDQRALWVSLMKGNVDLASSLSPEFFEIVAHDRRLATYASTYSSCYTLQYNLRRPLFSDRRVRQAIACAVDRNALIKDALLGQGVVATGPFLPGTWPCDPTISAIPYDSGKALELLREAGWNDPDGDGFLGKNGQSLEFTVLIDQGDDMKQKAAGLIRLQLEEIGVRIRVKALPYALMIKRIRAGSFDVSFAQINPGLDPDVASIVWGSKAAYNFGSYENTEADALFDRGRVTYSYDKRQEIYHKIHATLVQDHPAVFLFYPRRYGARTIRLKGAPNMSAIQLFSSVEQWRLTK